MCGVNGPVLPAELSHVMRLTSSPTVSEDKGQFCSLPSATAIEKTISVFFKNHLSFFKSSLEMIWDITEEGEDVVVQKKTYNL